MPSFLSLGRSSRRRGAFAIAALLMVAPTFLPTPVGGLLIDYARGPRDFKTTSGGTVQLQTRGYIDDDCLHQDAPCLTQYLDKLKPEATAQAKAIRQLEFMYKKTFDPLIDRNIDWIQWEVGPSSNAWRVDIVVENPGLPQPFGMMEVKNWQGGAAVAQVDSQLQGYITSASSVNIAARRHDELNVAQWSKAYVDDTGNVMCVWADKDAFNHPGNIYFAPASDSTIPVDVECKGANSQAVTDGKNDEQTAQANASLAPPKPMILPLVEKTKDDKKGKWHISAPRTGNVPTTVRVCYGDGACQNTAVAAGPGVAYFYATHTYITVGSFTVRATMLETGAFTEGTTTVPSC